MNLKYISVFILSLLFLNTAASGDTPTDFRFSDIEIIEENAFYGDTSLEKAEIPETSKVIESGAFSGCTGLSVIYCYSKEVSVAPDAFDNTENIHMYCYKGSSMETYAGLAGMKIGYLDALEISCNTVNNGCKDLPIPWTVTCTLPGEKTESTYVYRVYKDGTPIIASAETDSTEFVYTPTASGSYELEVTTINGLSETIMKSEKVSVAETLYIGVYEQDANSGTIDPIEWIVIHAAEEKAFLLSKYILKTDSFFDPSWIKYKYCNSNDSLITTHKSSNNWYPSAEIMNFRNIDGVTMVPKKDGTYISNDELSSLYHARYWCNGTFYGNAFTAEEKERILLTKNANPENPEYSDIDGGPDTYDYVFFLSYEELTKYLPDSSDRKTANTQAEKISLVQIPAYTGG